jgi:hypothetical protein
MASTVFPAAGGGVTQKVQVFTSTGTFVTPSNCSSVEVLVVGGGGGGGAGNAQSTGAGRAAGGGGGGTVRKSYLTVTPGTSYTVTIGAGGAGGTASGAGAVGGDTSFGALITALGGGGAASRNTSTFFLDNPRGTIGAIGTGSQDSLTSGGGGAGGNAYGFNNSGTQAFTNNTDSVANSANIPRGINTNTLGAGGGPVMATGSDGTMQAGLGIDGYGAGGPGSYATASNPPTRTAQAYSFSGLLPAVASGNGTATNGGNGLANSGSGGGGGAAQGASVSITGLGGNGGSGYVQVIFWS